ncbi:hypothetical protein TVAG_010000 [Trichomonas vaginalis G3]|uniref:DUF3447 domain-containing protein n=1 Tax=Trichomonas vaginalis (strain ATCC PRA-98 / G3) TaxID=412133 RepID=A2FA17_TRIV3|nr:hypothetical protein TVAG_010000 [Trichomonas vaginalis G3]|eukprot:XP_001311155.1 hypothetical protein [Trichomonas vaginalis G3]
MNKMIFSELTEKYKDVTDTFNAIYSLKSENEEEIENIYQLIKTKLMETNTISLSYVLSGICNAEKFRNRYMKSYYGIFKKLVDEFKPKEIPHISILFDYLIYKETGVVYDVKHKLNFKNFMASNSLSSYENDELYKSIINNDKESFIIQTGKEGFNANKVYDNGLFSTDIIQYTLLELCCYYGAVDCFKILRSNYKSEITDECLLLSFLSGIPDIVNECLKYQQPTEKCMKYAIISHNIDFVCFLMNEYGLEIDLDYCCKFNNLQALLIYLDQTNDIEKCFVYSSCFGNSLIEYFLAQGVNINSRDQLGRTALHIATLYNNIESLELLISKGIDINGKDEFGRTAVYFAAENNLVDILKVLFSHGADINAVNTTKRSALHVATLNRCKEAIEFLVSHGAEINAYDNFNNSPLHIAVGNSWIDISRLFISNGAEVNCKNQNGRTCLHIAACNNNKEAAELLISSGADVNAKDIFEETPLQAASHYNNQAVIEVLISHGAEPATKVD